MSVTIYEKVGFIDTKGNMVIRPCCNGGGLGFSEGLAPGSLGVDDPKGPGQGMYCYMK
ncbi:hypothetical protein [Clostridium sp.]